MSRFFPGPTYPSPSPAADADGDRPHERAVDARERARHRGDEAEAPADRKGDQGDPRQDLRVRREKEPVGLGNTRRTPRMRAAEEMQATAAARPLVKELPGDSDDRRSSRHQHAAGRCRYCASSARHHAATDGTGGRRAGSVRRSLLLQDDVVVAGRQQPASRGSSR